MNDDARRVAQLGICAFMSMLLLVQIFQGCKHLEYVPLEEREPSEMFAISGNCTYSKPLGKNVRMTVCGKGLEKIIDIRQFVRDPEKGWKPTIKGIGLDIEQWSNFGGATPWIEKHL